MAALVTLSLDPKAPLHQSHPPLTRHVVLIGMPGAGKSTMAPRVARAWNVDWVDLDAEIERRAGQTVADLFATRGEVAFRAMESALTEELLVRPPMVWATGGGWVTAERALERALPLAHVIHLRVSVPEAARRLRLQGPVGAVRPLLAVPNLEARLGELWAQREALYGQAHDTVDTERVEMQQLTDFLAALVARALHLRVG